MLFALVLMFVERLQGKIMLVKLEAEVMERNRLYCGADSTTDPDGMLPSTIPTPIGTVIANRIPMGCDQPLTLGIVLSSISPISS